MSIGPISHAFRAALSSPGIEAVWRFRQMYPSAGQILNALMGRFPNLTGYERQALLNIGIAAADAASVLENLPPQSGFPLDDVPVNEYLNLDLDSLNRGRVAINITAEIANMGDRTDWQFYIDTTLGETLGQFKENVRARAQEIIEKEVVYYEGATIPPNLEVEVNMKWTMRLY